MLKMKEKDANPKEQLNEDEIYNLPKKNTKYDSKDDPNLRRRTEAQINNIHEMFNRETEDLKNKQSWTIQ